MAGDTVGKDNAGGVRAVERAIDILEAFSRSKPSMSVSRVEPADALSIAGYACIEGTDPRARIAAAVLA